jgi:hypothetical protein
MAGASPGETRLSQSGLFLGLAMRLEGSRSDLEKSLISVVAQVYLAGLWWPPCPRGNRGSRVKGRDNGLWPAVSSSVEALQEQGSEWLRICL